MLLEGRAGKNRVVEARSEFGSSVPPTWAMLNGNISASGRVISPGSVVTIPTIIGGLQLIAATAAALPFIIYEGLGNEKKPRYDVWQYEILETYPGPFTDPFQLKHDIFWHLENYGNAFILKVKDPKTNLPTELVMLDPDAVAIRNVNGMKTFDVKTGSNTIFKGATPNEILHIKFLPKRDSLFTGTCALQLIGARLGAELSATEWEGRFFENDATPPLVITLGEDAGTDEMKEAYDSFMIAHAGTYNAGKPVILGGGASITKLGFNMADSQLVEAHSFNVMEFCRAMNLPLTFFLPPHTKPSSAEDDALLFNTFYLSPRLARVTSAFNSDPDFFAYNDMWCRFDEREMLRPNTLAFSTAMHSYVQDGVLLPDEVRAELGYDALPPLMSPEDAAKNPGKIPQITPVGGAPNDQLVDASLTKEVKDVHDPANEVD